MTQRDSNSNNFPFGNPETDLLSQISAEDEVHEANKSKSKKSSAVMNLFVELMRLTFYFDELKRRYELLFAILVWLWSGLITIIYIGGICALGLLVYSYSQFPEYVRNFFRENNITVEHFEMPEYTFSRLEIKNLQDKAGTYTIKSLVINSTFADFLQRRVKSVVLDGVTIRAKEGENGEINLGMLPQFLVSLNLNRTSRSIKIDTLSVTNAVLELDGYDLKIPVSFSFTGVYEDSTKISVPFFVKQKEMDLMGTLSVTGTFKKMTFVVDITSGTLTLPRKSPENITAKITVETGASKIDKINGNIDLVYGRNTKKFKWNMSREKESYRGTLDMAFVNVDVADKAKELKSNVSLNFDGIKFKHLSDFETDRPIRMTVQSFYRPNVSVSRLFSTLNGKLNCHKMDCSYTLTRESPVSIEDMTFKYEGDTIRSVSETSFVLKPNGKKPLFIISGDKLDYHMLIDQFSFSGYKNSQVAPLSLNANGMALDGIYPFMSNDPTLSLNIKQMNYGSVDQDLTDAKLSVDNVFNDTSKLSLKSKVVFKNNPFFGVPVNMTLENKGLDTQAEFSILDGKIHVTFDGAAKLDTGEFSGNIYIAPFKAQDVRVPLSDVSRLFPKDIRNPSGQIAAIGRLSWGGTTQITGPFYVAFKDVGFERGNIKVQGMNGVVLFQSLYPITTAVNQRIFIQKLVSVLPFENIDMRFKMDHQFVRLNSLTTDVAGIKFLSDSMLLPYRTTNMIVYLKNNTVDLSKVNPFIKKSGLTISGSANVVLPLEFRNKKMSLKNAELKMLDGSVSYTKDSIFKPDFMDNSKEYKIKSGTFLINSGDENEVGLDVSLSTTGQLLPSDDKKNVHKNMMIDVLKFIDKHSIQKIPSEIVQRQKVVFP